MRKISLLKDSVIIVLLSILSIIFIYFFSNSTSPFIPGYYSFDSAIFQVIGKSWERGIIPYSQCFDHKGPIIFLINALGYKLGMGREGVAVIQCLFMIPTFILIYKLSGLFLNEKLSMITTVLSFIVLKITYDCGNLTEEYSLLFIMASLYVGFKYLKKIDFDKEETISYPWKYGLINGASFMWMFLLRVTNAISVCTLVLVVLVILLKNKKYKNILHNAVSFIAGALIVFLPFAVYFTIKDSFYDMMFGTIIYNILYAAESSFSLTGAVILAMFSSIMMIIISILHIICTKRKRDIMGIYMLFTAIVSLILFTRMNGYEHYYMITLPYFAICVGFIWDIKKEKVLKRIALFTGSTLLIIQVLFGGYKIIRYKSSLEHFDAYTKEYQAFVDEFNSHIPENEKEQVLTFGRNSLSAWYLVNDIDPTFKYCFVQDWQAKNSEKMTDEIFNYLNNKPAKWLVTNADPKTNEIYMPYNKEFEKVILERYELIDSYSIKTNYESYNLYRLKE